MYEVHMYEVKDWRKVFNHRMKPQSLISKQTNYFSSGTNDIDTGMHLLERGGGGFAHGKGGATRSQFLYQTHFLIRKGYPYTITTITPLNPTGRFSHILQNIAVYSSW